MSDNAVAVRDEELEAPELLMIPPKLERILDEFNHYKIFVIEGGRGSAKSHSVARLLLYITQERVVRIFCGREIQNTIEESVYTLLLDLINKYTLPFRSLKATLRHFITGSRFNFKGFRERGAINLKGIEGADIVWVDEAQGLQKVTLDYMLPTLRKETPVKFIFTLNRLFRDDAVMELTKREDCLHIHIDYFDNPYCPATLLDEAEICRLNNIRDYNHIWLGQPAVAGDEYIFDFDKLYASLNTEPWGDQTKKQRILSIDAAFQGNDNNVASIIDRESPVHWKLKQQIKWQDPDTTLSVGRIIGLIGEHKPDVVILDVGGAGWDWYCQLSKIPGLNIFPFNGAETDGIDVMAANRRADAYWIARDWFGLGWIIVTEENREVLKQLEKIKRVFRNDGKRQVERKDKMKAEIGHSPDEADSLVMGIYAIVKYLGSIATTASSQTGTGVITRKTGSTRRR